MKGHKDDDGLEHLDEEGLRTGIFQLVEERAQGDLSNMWEYLRGGYEEMQSSFFQWCLASGPEAKGTTCSHRSF